MKSPNSRPDFSFDNHGSLVLLRPLTHAAHDWADQHIGQDNGFQPYWPTVILVEPRYVSEIFEGIKADGLAVTL